jgi:hypothetical protein
MTNIPRILPFDGAIGTAEQYDLAIATIGYEKRARFLSERFDPPAKIKMACGFTKQRVLNYAANQDWFTRSGFAVTEREDRNYKQWCAALLDRVKPGKAGATVRLWVDISSASRFRLATLIDCIRQAGFPVSADFVYAPAKFSSPPQGKVPNFHVGPITELFAGWTPPDRTSVAIVGLGYEDNKALGAVEHIQATDVWTFIPHSRVGRYIEALMHANAILLERIPEQKRLDYIVERPFDCFVMLESLVNRICETKIPILFPFGPKIFNLCALLVGCIYSQRVAVWRVSAGGEGEAIDREAEGEVCGLRAEFAAAKTQVASAL